MDEVLARQLLRQLKVIKFWVAFFGFLFLATLVIVAFLIFKLVTVVHNTEQKLSDLQSKTSNTLNLKQEVCSDKSLSSLLASNPSICQ